MPSRSCFTKNQNRYAAADLSHDDALHIAPRPHPIFVDGSGAEVIAGGDGEATLRDAPARAAVYLLPVGLAGRVGAHLKFVAASAYCFAQ